MLPGGHSVCTKRKKELRIKLEEHTRESTILEDVTARRWQRPTVVVAPFQLTTFNRQETRTELPIISRRDRLRDLLRQRKKKNENDSRKKLKLKKNTRSRAVVDHKRQRIKQRREQELRRPLQLRQTPTGEKTDFLDAAQYDQTAFHRPTTKIGWNGESIFHRFLTSTIGLMSKRWFLIQHV